MSEVGAIVIGAVALFGSFLYLRMVEENRRTRPARVRQQLLETMLRHGMDEAAQKRVLKAHDDAEKLRAARNGSAPIAGE